MFFKRLGATPTTGSAMTTEPFETVFSSFKLKNVTFSNRILRSSVGGRMAAYNGMVTDIWKNFEKRFADGGVAGIISTTFNIDQFRQSPLEYPSIADDKFISPLKKALTGIKETGCKYIVQIGDPGYATQMSLFPEKQDALSSSSGFELLYGYGNRRIGMDEETIEKTIKAFADAGERVRAADADGVEITAEKGYIIHQFLNPGINRRKDCWGGSVEGRFRLLEEIVKAVRSKIGKDFLLGVRLSASDYNYLPIQNFIFRAPWVFPLRYHFRGNDEIETLEYGKKLKRLGVDYLHIVSGYGFINPRGNPGSFPFEEIKLLLNATRHLSFKAAARATLINCLPSVLARPLFSIGWRYKEGINLGYAERFKREVQLPVISNGGFQHGSTIEAALRDGKCDFVSMARALIADPDLVKVLRGDVKPRKACTFCNRCCARTATSPLGCYEPKRFLNREIMQRQIMTWNTPD
jgi:2,4-dienoyl-CoA reductase (NADPH2)